MSGPASVTGASLRWTAEPPAPQAVALVLHGGRKHDTGPTGPWQLAVARLRPFAWAIARSAGGQMAVVSLQYAKRGWNAEQARQQGREPDPVVDTRWALEVIRQRYPGVPITLVGHSMGGRVALRLADAEAVAAVVTVGAWVEKADEQHWGRVGGMPMLLIHSPQDRVTDPAGSAYAAIAFSQRGADARYQAINGDGHGMVRHPGQWHSAVAEYVVAQLIDAGAGS
ncbi:lysophospholipase [Ornithinimicrobium sp. Arc0846-15]|nr:lysophospholipase [Ornithinimicrobium laminariae]